MKHWLAGLAMAGILCSTALPLSAQAAEEQMIQVGLAYGSTARSAVQLENADGTGYNIGTMDGTAFSAVCSVPHTRLTIAPLGSGLAVRDTDSGQVLYQSDTPALALSPKGDLTWFEQNRYRGEFVCTRAGEQMTVVNVVDLEDYIKGVVPYEMSASWPREALKAQAVCARSYADGQRDRHKSQGFQVCNTTHCQVYRGIGRATENSDVAVDETRGQYLYQDGKRVVGYFFSSDGGATESAVNVWGGDHAYLTGKADPYEDTAHAANGVWSVTLTADEVQTKLRNAGYDIGSIKSMQVTRRTAMGNVNELTVTDVNGRQVALTREKCRTVLGLNSIRYTIGGMGPALTADPSTAESSVPQERPARGQTSMDPEQLYVTPKTSVRAETDAEPSKPVLPGLGADPAASGTSYTFRGTGWGHSVGMSQYGAKAMAEQGHAYDDILRFYFTGITVG